MKYRIGLSMILFLAILFYIVLFNEFTGKIALISEIRLKFRGDDIHYLQNSSKGLNGTVLLSFLRNKNPSFIREYLGKSIYCHPKEWLEKQPSYNKGDGRFYSTLFDQYKKATSFCHSQSGEFFYLEDESGNIVFIDLIGNL